MGFAMARNLLKHGFRVNAWNRSFEKIEPLAAAGAELAETPAAAAGNADTIVTMVADGDAVTAAMEGDDGALRTAGSESLWLQMSTIGEEATAACMQLAGEHGLGFVDAPVLGTKQPAEAGALVVLASGPDELRGRAQPVFDAVGSRTLWLGDAGTGTLLKLVANSWIVATVQGAAETIALAERLGLDPERFFDAIADGPLDMDYLRIKGRAMIERNFEPSFSLRLAAKDARLVEASADRRGMELPLVTAVRRQLEAAARDHGDDDLSATFLALAPTASASR